ncbi:uncharacterized protein [Ptychodera flava]|uniref:uncharacterized protein n=1 Tax=Ptychodera flava TaxID=63121 RepID=UPI00396A289C
MISSIKSHRVKNFRLQELYKQDSSRDAGTFKYYKELLQRNNLPADVTRNYDAAKQFLILMVNAFVTEAALEFFSMENTTSQPLVYHPPVASASVPVKRNYIDTIIGRFVDEFILPNTATEWDLQRNGGATAGRPTLPEREDDMLDHGYCITHHPSHVDHEDEHQPVQMMHDHNYTSEHPIGVTQIPDGDVDRVRLYSKTVLELGMMFIQLDDTHKEGDGDRDIINWKYLLMYFKSRKGHHSNYAIEAVNKIAQVQALLSEQMAQRVLWGRFVNQRGGAGNNFPSDLRNELHNNFFKSVVKAMGAQKTKSAILRASKAATGLYDIACNFDDVTNIKPEKTDHPMKCDTADLNLVLDDLRMLRPYRVTPGRRHEHFPHIGLSPLERLNMPDLYAWIRRKANEIADDQGIPCDDSSDNDT